MIDGTIVIFKSNGSFEEKIKKVFKSKGWCAEEVGCIQCPFAMDGEEEIKCVFPEPEDTEKIVRLIPKKPKEIKSFDELSVEHGKHVLRVPLSKYIYEYLTEVTK